MAELAWQVVAASVLPRLRRLPAEVKAFAEAVAVLGDRVELRHAAAPAGIDTGPAIRAADTLIAAGILVHGRPIEFVRPTVRRAVYESLPAGEYHRAHRQAAALLDREGAAADRIATHLVAAERWPTNGSSRPYERPRGRRWAGAPSTRPCGTCGGRWRSLPIPASAPTCCSSSARSRRG